MMSEALRKAAEQALDALSNAVPCTSEQVTEQCEAIDALRAVLAAPEQSEPVAWMHIPHATISDKVRPVVSLMKYNEPDIYLEPIPLYTAAPAQTPAPLPRLSDMELHEILSGKGWAENDYDDWGYERAIETAVRRQFGVNDE
jgi:hypothetical protein